MQVLIVKYNVIWIIVNKKKHMFTFLVILEQGFRNYS